MGDGWRARPGARPGWRNVCASLAPQVHTLQESRTLQSRCLDRVVQYMKATRVSREDPDLRDRVVECAFANHRPHPTHTARHPGSGGAGGAGGAGS